MKIGFLHPLRSTGHFRYVLIPCKNVFASAEEINYFHRVRLYSIIPMSLCKRLGEMMIGLIVLAALGAACKSSRRDDTSQTKIIFVNLKIVKDERGRESVALVSKKWITGDLKERDIRGHVIDPLICEFHDAKDDLLATLTIQNPLNESFERFDSDGSVARQPGT